MKGLKRLSSTFIALLLVLTMIAPAYAKDTINVTLRVETMDKTIYPKTEVEVEKKEDITPQDVLKAAGIEYENNQWGSVEKLAGIEDMWCYAINNDSTISPAVLKEGDNLVYYLYDYSQGKYIYFEKEDYQTTVDKSINVSLKGEIYDNGHKEVNISDVEVLYREAGEENYKSTHQYTDSKGNVSLDFDKKGIYEITALSKGSSRPYAKIEVKGESKNQYENINKTIASFDIPKETTENIVLPTYSSTYWNQMIVWTSSNPDVISNEGIVTRGKENQTVTLTVEVSETNGDKKISKKAKYTVVVLADDSKYEAGEIKKKDVIWSSDSNNQAVTNEKTSINTKDVQAKWINSKVQATSSPVIVGDKIYVTNSKNQLVQLDRNGKILNRVNLSSSLSYVTDICYGDGMLFVPLGNGTIQAFNEDTLSPLWISEKQNGPITSKLTYHNGYVYAGTFGSSKASPFFAINVKDEDTTKGNEIKKVSWSYDYDEKDRNGYYCNQAKVIGNNIYFVGDDGILVSHALTSQKVNKTIKLDVGVRSGITYDGNYIYVMTRSTTLYKISKDLKIIGKVQLEKNGSSTSTPTINNGRIYVGGVKDSDDFYSKGFMAVIDAKTMKVIVKKIQ